nr:flagellin [Pseudoalteromonas sp. C2R02]
MGESSFISGLDVSDPTNTQLAINEALEVVSASATALGADTNGLNSQISTYETSSINSSASRSRILDTDYAKDTSEQKTNNLLLQASLLVKKEDEERKGLLINKLV